ncbi:hypothetical protein QFZ63_002151 [Streptomyces sp. B3I7]|nr:hypothetical protein [Streptomyces sp. B3I7]
MARGESAVAVPVVEPQHAVGVAAEYVVSLGAAEIAGREDAVVDVPAASHIAVTAGQSAVGGPDPGVVRDAVVVGAAGRADVREVGGELFARGEDVGAVGGVGIQVAPGIDGEHAEDGGRPRGGRSRRCGGGRSAGAPGHGLLRDMSSPCDPGGVRGGGRSAGVSGSGTGRGRGQSSHGEDESEPRKRCERTAIAGAWHRVSPGEVRVRRRRVPHACVGHRATRSRRVLLGHRTTSLCPTIVTNSQRVEGLSITVRSDRLGEPVICVSCVTTVTSLWRISEDHASRYGRAIASRQVAMPADSRVMPPARRR